MLRINTAIWSLVIIFFIVSLAIVPANSDTKKRVAVLYFEDHSNFDSPTGCGCLPVGPFGFLFGSGGRREKWDLKTGFRDLLNERLEESQFYDVVKLEDLFVAMAELEISRRSLKREEKRAELADKLNLDAMIIGDIRKFNQERAKGIISRTFRGEIENTRTTGVTGMGAAGQYYRASVHLEVKICDSVGKEVSVAQVKKDVNYERGGFSAGPITAVASNRGSSVKIGSAKVESGKRKPLIVRPENLNKIKFGSPEYKQTLFWVATERALDETILKLRQKIGPEIIESIPPETIAQKAKPTLEPEGTTSKPPPSGLVKGKIASVTENPPQAYINLGSEAGIKIGDRFTVYTEGKAITDPDTGGLLGYEEEIVGKVEIIDIMSGRMSKANILLGVGKIARLNVVKRVEE